MAVGDKQFEHLTVVVPEGLVGLVSGELSRRGAWLDGLSNDGGLCSVLTRLPIEEVASFSAWLKALREREGFSDDRHL
jgi:hypothetical protein